MDTAHSVRQLSFEVSFGTEAAAFAQQDGLRSFVSGRLRTVLDEVLSACAPSDNTVLRIDRLDIDLGRVAAASYYEEAERRLRDKLQEAVTRALADSGSGATRVLTSKQNELEIIGWFLETGQLPWNFSTATRQILEDMLQRVIHDSGALLAARLESARDRDALAKRLAWQFPPDLYSAVAGLWNPSEDLASPPPEEETAEQERLLEEAMSSGEAAGLAPVWKTLLLDHPELITGSVRTLGLRAEVRRLIARGFPESMLRDIAGLLEPSEVDFIEELTGRPRMFQEAAAESEENAGTVESGPMVRAHLWEFTLTYLLVERGGNFNRRSYVASVLRQMAAHENRSCRSLLISIEAVLDRVELHSRLREELLGLLAELAEEDEAADAPDATSGLAPSPEVLLTAALTSGDAQLLSRYWSVMVRDQRSAVKQVVTHLGIHPAVRRSMAFGFPEPMRRDIAAILEPSEAGFIEELVDSPGLFHDAGERCGAQPHSPRMLKSRLWELTFAWLLVERGSRFNRRSYAVAVVRGMAAHDNLNYRDLLTAMAGALDGVRASSPVQRQLRSLLSELRPGEPETGSAAAPENSREELLERALTTGDAQPLLPHWPRLLRDERSTVERILRRLAVSAEVRRAMARGFSDPMLRDIAGILSPSGIRCIEEFIRAEPIFLSVIREAIGQHPESELPPHSLLWEITLTELLTAPRMFSGRLYIAGVLRRIAARCSLKYEDLVASLAAATDRAGASELLKREVRALSAAARANFAEFEAALIRGDAERILPLWQTCLVRDRSALRRVVRRMAMRPEIRASVARGFPEPLLRDIVGLLEPGAAAFIAGFVRQAPDLFQPDSMPESLRRDLWEFSLSFLLVERGRRFRRETYLAAMVRHVALRDNLTCRDVVTSLSARLAIFPANDAVGRHVVRLLRRHEEEFSSAAEAIRSCELYDTLSDCLLRGAAPPAEGLSGLIDELVRKYPDQLARLLREWRAQVLDEAAGKGPPPPWHADLPPDAGHIARNRSQYRLLLAELFRKRQPASRSAPAGNGPSEPQFMPEQQVADALMRAANLSAGERARLIRALDLFPAQPPEGLLRLLRTLPGGAALWAGLVGVLPERHLTRILQRIVGDARHSILSSANALVNAALARGLGPPARLQQLKWRFLFEYLVRAGNSAAEKEFARRFQAQLRGKAAARAKAKPAKAEKKDPMNKEDNRHDIHIRNAGQVLATPYLPRLFQMLGLLEGKAFRDAECAGRAAHLLQYMVDQSIDPPEHELILNKILCGLEPTAPVMRVPDLTQAEKDAVDGLLRAMIAHWAKIGDTSVQGLRESFLQRDGRLRVKREDSWQLLVGPRVFDMLLDSLPWSFSVIRHPWMTRTVFVEWR